jgi:cytoskeletal protein CcmA (bactofilin family)
MALKLNDRVKETSTTTGTGTLDLSGAVSGFQTFVAGIGNGNTTYYAIVNRDEAEWETGLGTITDASTDTLARTTVLASSNSDSAVTFSAGTKDVFCTLPASKVANLDANDNLIIGSGSAGVDYTLTFDGADSDGLLTWMEDEDYFKFSDDILINSTEKIQFYDTGLYIYSSTDGQLDIVADTEVQIAATTIDINGAVALNGAITGATDITLSGELDAATLDISGNADIDGTLEADAITIGGTAIGSIYSVVAGSSSIVTTGALDSGSITSGFGAIDNGTSNIRSATITAETAFVPDASGGADLGTTSLEFNDAFFNDSAVINFGDDQDVTLTHVADTGLTLADAHANGTNFQINNTAGDGDAAIQFALSGTVQYTMGVEDGDSDKFVINYGTGALGAQPALEISSAGVVTIPVLTTVTSWQAVITGATTMVSGRGYFVNTTSSAFTMTLPASPSIGDFVHIIDYAATFDSNNCTVGRNSEKILGATSDLVVATERAAFQLVYVDSTQGWLLTEK